MNNQPFLSAKKITSERGRSHYDSPVSYIASVLHVDAASFKGEVFKMGFDCISCHGNLGKRLYSRNASCSPCLIHENFSTTHFYLFLIAGGIRLRNECPLISLPIM